MAGAPVANMFSAYGGIRWESGNSRTSQYEHGQSRIGGTPWEFPERYIENSPLFHADKIVRPLIVLQGANDPRVIKPESDEIVENIRKRNGTVEYVVFDNEGHGFTKKANEIRAYKAILDFLDKHLKGAPPAGR